MNDYYCTFLEVLNFTEDAWKLLTDLAASVQEFKLELNADVLSYYFNLFTRYVQIHLLVKLIETPEMYIASFARAFHCTSGNSEPNYLRIAKYLATFRSAPLKKMQEDAAAISLCVGTTLMTFMPILMKYSTVQGYAQGKLFNIIQEDAKNLTVANNEKLQLEVLHLANLRNWVLWGFLICPAELARPGALDLLSLCLRETFHLQIFRDKTLNIHKEFDELQDSYKSPNGTFKLSKHKKVFKDAYSDEEGTRKFHQDLRTYLRTELEVAEKFFNEAPSCLAPKLSMIFALLALSRNEIVWFFRHQHIIPFKCSSSKVKGLVYDTQIPLMIELVLQVSKLVESNKKDIQSYYVEALTKNDATKARSVCDQFLSSLHNPQLSALVHAMIDPLADRTASDNLESIRLNWYRISAAVNHQQSGIPIHSTTAFSGIMNTIVSHSRNIDCIETQLKTHASFQQLFFYKNDIFESLKETLKSVDGSTIHCGAYVQLLGSALHNIHRLCPDEQPVIGKEVVTTGDAFIRLIVNSLERCIQGVINDTNALRSKTNYNAVIQRIQHVNAMALNPQLPPVPSPGDESQWETRRNVQNLAIYHKTISDICSSITRNDVIILYNIEFAMREYVHEAISKNIRDAIVNLAVQGPAIAKPTMVLNRLKDTIAAFAAVERALNINVHDIARDVLLSEFAPPADEITAIQAADADPNRPIPIIMHIASWYTSIFSTDLAQQGIVYSSVKKAFVSRKVQTGGAQSTLEFERFTDVPELRALATLVGPAGIAVIDRSLMKVIGRSMKVVKEVLSVNQGTLANLAGRFTEQSVWFDNIPALREMDQLCQATTVIGCILHFRQLLRSALNYSTHERSNFIYQSVSLAYRAVHEGVVVDPKLNLLDQTAQDVGLDVGEADHPLRLAFAGFKTTVADVNMFALLPELYGLMYLSQRWRHAQFSIEFDGHLNNTHCMAIAIRQILVQFNRIQVKEGATTIDIEKRIAADLERFIKCSAFTMLHMKALNARERESQLHYPLQSIMVFLEQAMVAFAGRVEMSTLESCLPFTILRTAFIQQYEKQTNIHASERQPSTEEMMMALRFPLTLDSMYSLLSPSLVCVSRPCLQFRSGCRRIRLIATCVPLVYILANALRSKNKSQNIHHNVHSTEFHANKKIKLKGGLSLHARVTLCS